VASGAPEALGEGEGKAEPNELALWACADGPFSIYPHNSENLADCAAAGLNLESEK
jgi:hypothetical protein